ncbi:MAG: hypothetical protein IBX50_08270 [Marinospirillum sp.]|uniref:hypothetical protein n=1 Tax=Marinospirillum sp. TaxID=2183934 RepID=UPI0019E41801|nr:hypothetical protein [Marinospirillum sp.]MBE0506701.1 hypothetical protein [Marinospirillum sp.]
MLVPSALKKNSPLDGISYAQHHGMGLSKAALDRLLHLHCLAPSIQRSFDPPITGDSVQSLYANMGFTSPISQQVTSAQRAAALAVAVTLTSKEAFWQEGYFPDAVDLCAHDVGYWYQQITHEDPDTSKIPLERPGTMDLLEAWRHLLESQWTLPRYNEHAVLLDSEHAESHLIGLASLLALAIQMHRSADAHEASPYVSIPALHTLKMIESQAWNELQSGSFKCSALPQFSACVQALEWLGTGAAKNWLNEKSVSRQVEPEDLLHLAFALTRSQMAHAKLGHNAYEAFELSNHGIASALQNVYEPEELRSRLKRLARSIEVREVGSWLDQAGQLSGHLPSVQICLNATL